jgi:hypothetical protein
VLLLSLHVQRLLTRNFRSRTDPFTREPLVMGQVRKLMLLQCGCLVALVTIGFRSLYCRIFERELGNGRRCCSKLDNRSVINCRTDNK